MRTNAIIRIIIWSIVIVLLVSILGCGLLYRSHRINDRPPAETAVPIPIENTEPIQGTATEQSSFSTDNIQELKIEWAAGTISIRPDPSIKTILVSESDVHNEKYRMMCKTRGDKLTISYTDEAVSGFGISIGEDLRKDLTILVPTDWVCRNLDIDAASANLEVSDLTIQEVEFDGASGVCHFDNCTVDNLDVDTASGDIYFQGALEVLDFDAASASFYGVMTIVPRRLEMDGMSGNLELTLPENAGFTVETEGLSTNFTSDFTTTTRNGAHIHGDGECQIRMEGMSGKVIIHKAQ